jgi:hypothetical protein
MTLLKGLKNFIGPQNTLVVDCQIHTRQYNRCAQAEPQTGVSVGENGAIHSGQECLLGLAWSRLGIHNW